MIDLSFESNIDAYLDQFENKETEEIQSLKTAVKEDLVMKIGDQEVEVLIECLQGNVEFKGKLKIVNQDISNQTVIKLCEVLEKQDKTINDLNIEVLDLSGNSKLNRYSGVYLGNMLLKNKTIKQLVLQNNNLENDGVNRIIECLAFNSSLNSLDLGKIGDYSLQNLTEFIKIPHQIKYLAF